MEKEKITIKTIEKLSDLSKLDFSQEEKEKLLGEVSGIIEMLDKCGDVDVSDTSSFERTTLADLREDITAQSLAEEDAFRNAHVHKNGYYGVPRVVE